MDFFTVAFFGCFLGLLESGSDVVDVPVPEAVAAAGVVFFKGSICCHARSFRCSFRISYF